RVGGVAVHAVRLELEHERLDPAGAARLGLLLRDVAGRARHLRRPLVVDEVRVADRATALVRLPRRARRPPAPLVHRRLRRDDRDRVLPALLRAVALACDHDLLPPHVRLSVRPRLALLALGLASVPRPRHPEPPLAAADPPGPAPRRRRRTLLVAAPPLGPPARGLHERAARRLRARADPLVLPLPPVVLPIRGDRTARRLVAVGAAVAVFIGCWVGLHHWFYAHRPLSDVPIYQGYGNAIDHGLVPYRDFPVEYPPGALPVFVAPIYLHGYSGYAHMFGWLMAALGVGCIVVAAFAGASVRALALIAVSPLLIGSMALSRYDFWPTLLVVCALAALVHDRHRLGWIALGAAVVTKLFALVVLPLALVWTLRRR